MHSPADNYYREELPDGTVRFMVPTKRLIEQGVAFNRLPIHPEMEYIPDFVEVARASKETVDKVDEMISELKI